MTEKYEYCSTVPRNFVQDFFTEMNWNWFPYKNLQEKDSSCNFSLDWKLFQVWQAAKLSGTWGGGVDHYAFLGNGPPCGRGIRRLRFTNSKIPGLNSVGLKASIPVLVFLVLLPNS